MSVRWHFFFGVVGLHVTGTQAQETRNFEVEHETQNFILDTANQIE